MRLSEANQVNFNTNRENLWSTRDKDNELTNQYRKLRRLQSAFSLKLTVHEKRI